MSPAGTTLIGGTDYEYDPNYSNVTYALAAPNGSVGPTQTLARYPGIHSGAFDGAVFDQQGNATLIIGREDQGSPCCMRYEAAWLPRDGIPVRRERLEPPGANRIALDVAAGPRGERLGAWFGERKPGERGGTVQVLRARPGKRFGEPHTLVRSPHLDTFVSPRAVVQPDGMSWVFWSTTEDPRGARRTSLHAARRGPGQRRWHIRTVARATGPSDGRFVNPGGAGFAVAEAGDQLALVWRDCDGRPDCQLRWRSRRAGAWGRAQSIPHEGSLTESPVFSAVVDSRGRTMFVFEACARYEGGVAWGDCALQIVHGGPSGLGGAELLGPGERPVMASNARGDTLLLYSATVEDDNGYRVDYYARMGSTTDAFGPSVLLHDGNHPDSGLYQPTLAGLGVDDRGNASFAYQSYDSIGGTLFRYRR